eukprot:CAMPEP_0174252214 /NCGR_PEP_ID=MMETSP0439-20130205/1783_1 /TAXON_ID=0 /ORGANISM="Stereomyxa ramosa, Strain Chinc5" /LENGTH=515 /DNA_ID=CAMNT_0015332723 /DNA_START=186 /DNA_END=1733 /DNA_ORIENTATION=+
MGSNASIEATNPGSMKRKNSSGDDGSDENCLSKRPRFETREEPVFAPEMEYVPISSVSGSGKFNLFGIVVDRGASKKTKTSDWMTTVTICDQSSETLKINFFAYEEDELPSVDRQGLVLRVHRLWIREYQGQEFGCGKPHTGGFHFVIFDPVSEKVIQTSTPNYSWTSKDLIRAKAIASWWRSDNMPKMPNLELYRKRICDLAVYQWFDIVCKVMDIDFGDTPMITVWDGTKHPGLEESGNDSLLNMLSSQLKVHICVGTVVNSMRSGLNVGDWIRLRNIAAKEFENKLIGVFEEHSSYVQISSGSSAVKELNNDYQRRREAKKKELEDAENRAKEAETNTQNGHQPQTQPCQSQRSDPPQSQSIVHSSLSLPSKTVTFYEQIKLSTLHDIKNSKKGVMVYRTKCWIHSYSPEEFVHWSEKQDKFVYIFKLTLLDHTGSLDAFVYDEDGCVLFNGISAEECMNENKCEVLVKSKLKNVMKAMNEFCLKSYYSVDKDGNKKRNFRIFGTSIVDANS